MNRLTKDQPFLKVHRHNCMGGLKAPSLGVPMGDTILKLRSSQPGFYLRRPAGQDLLRHRRSMRNHQSSYIKTISSPHRALSCHSGRMRAVGHGTG